MEKVVNTRGGAVLVLAERFFFFSRGSTGRKFFFQRSLQRDRQLGEKTLAGASAYPGAGSGGVG